MRSGLYTGVVMHRRLRPREHSLRYNVFCLLVDLDEIPFLRGRFRLLGINGPGIMSFRETDHGDGAGDLKGWATRRLAAEGIDLDGGRIDVLCYPRMFGYVFNPLTVFFCHRRDGALGAILYEVNNTHGERHSYVLPATPGEDVVRHETAKVFFVSPFVPMDCTYRFSIAPPDRRVGVSIAEHDAEGLLLTASFAGTRRELSSGALLKLLFTYPLMTLKVVAGIHWEAIRLLAKGVPFLNWSPAKDDGSGPRPARPEKA